MRTLLIIALGTSLAACTTAPVDRPLATDGPRRATFNADLAQCRTIASNFDDGSVGESATLGAVLGGVFGGLIADDGDRAEGVLIGSAIGGAEGAFEASEKTDDQKRDILIRCMQNRGHAVLG